MKKRLRMTNNTQVCSKCGISKAINKFHKDNTNANNRRTECADCRSASRRITNITKEHRLSLQIAQNNSCAICGISNEELKKELNVDHNHETKKVRGLLCNNCNLGLGMFKDNTTHLSMAIEYLVTHDGIA